LISSCQAIISTRRLSRFLACSERKPEVEQTADSPSPISLDEQSEATFRNMAIVIHDACCAWSSSDEKELNMVLNHVTLDLPKGSFVVVTGEVRPVPEFFQNSGHPLLHI
jgi:ATP-binding cassette subfamily C (CFTR/MRP) protein 10